MTNAPEPVHDGSVCSHIHTTQNAIEKWNVNLLGVTWAM